MKIFQRISWVVIMKENANIIQTPVKMLCEDQIQGGGVKTEIYLQAKFS